jgi:SpoIVB peptidase S55
MRSCLAIVVVIVLQIGGLAQAAELTPPKAGKPEILPLKDVKPGMHAIAWTVFSGMTPEPVPVEIIGVWKNAMGPRQHVIMAKMGGKAERTGVAGGMSGSPVYVDGKLIGAVALRLSQFSPDAICGITPIESMLEIQDLDMSRPSDARTPNKLPAPQPAAAYEMPSELVAQLVAAGGTAPLPSRSPLMTPIETPLVFSGFTAETLNTYEPLLRQIGITPVQGGAAAGTLTAKPAPGWEHALNPGEAVSGILVSGDMSTTGMGTVTYNDGKRILAFGHQFFDLGPVDMPIAKSEILTVLSSTYQPNKVGNATEVVGALRQDRFTGIMGELGAEAPVIPVHVKVRAYGENGAVVKEKDLNFSVFVQQKWTPFLMSATLSNSLQQMNLYADEMTYRFSGDVLMDGSDNIHVSTMLAPGEFPVPMPTVLAGWWGDKFNRLFLNNVAMPKLKSVEAVVDLLPARRVATIETVWTPTTEVEAGTDIPVKVYLRPYRGERIERSLTVKIPAGMPKGEHRLLFSDADTLDRSQDGAVKNNKNMDIPSTVSLLNQERDNNRLYVSLVQSRATFYTDDKTLPNLPSSVVNVMQTERNSSRSLVGTPESTQVQQSIPFDQVVSGNYSLRIKVK